MTRGRAAQAATDTPPAPAPVPEDAALPMPAGGGSYIRQPDGTLIRQSEETTDGPA